jgi:hypothetical protein
MEGVKLNFALESVRQSLNHSRPQGRFCAVDHYAQYDERCHEQQSDSADPAPTADRLALPKRARRKKVRPNQILFTLCHARSQSSQPIVE